MAKKPVMNPLMEEIAQAPELIPLVDVAYLVGLARSQVAGIVHKGELATTTIRVGRTSFDVKDHKRLVRAVRKEDLLAYVKSHQPVQAGASQ